MNGGSNQTIRCTVNQCKYHENSKNLCSLDAITVGTHEANPTQEQCTDCLSFEVKQLAGKAKQVLALLVAVKH